MMLTVGSQRSYSDVCRLTNGRVSKVGNKILSFDKAWGIVRCEAGATLHDIMKVIVPHGWFFRVTPGTRWATIGGCIANDVHGKNQSTHGSFGNHVLTMNLPLTPTIGGLGLTGTIEWAEIHLEQRLLPFLPYYYPLDYTPYWWMVKRLGIKQYQCVVPPRAVKDLLLRMPPPLLMSQKVFGDIPSVGMLSFCRPGVALALDYLPSTNTDELDSIVWAYDGALNPSKTSMSQAMFRHSFPRWKEFSQFVDPGYSSDFWQRVNS